MKKESCKMCFVDNIPELINDSKIHLRELTEKNKDLLSDINCSFSCFWENLFNFGCKEYYFFTTRFIKGRCITFRLRTMIIKCIGGEYMSKENPKMVFVDDVPQKHGGRESFDFDSMLKQIPEGKKWKIGENDHPSIATVREYIKKNKSSEFNAVQRTVEGKKYLYVFRVPKKEKKQ